MGERINKEFEKFQEELKNREKKLKLITTFEPLDKLDDAINELKNKEVIL